MAIRLDSLYIKVMDGSRTIKPWLRNLDNIFLGAVLFFLSDTYFFQYLFSSGAFPEQTASEPAAPALGYRLITYASYLYILAKCTFHLKPVVKNILGSPPLLCMLSLILISALWSVDSDQTFYAARIYIFLTVLMIILLVTRGYEGALNIFAAVFCAILWLSYYFCLAVPDWALQEYTLDWRGIFYNKNTLGLFTCISTGLFLLKALTLTTGQKFFWYVQALLSALLLLLSYSATSFLSCLVSITLILAWIFLKKLRIYLIAFLPALLVIGLLLTPLIIGYVVPFFMEGFNKDTTLTGRTDIWAATLPVIGMRPLIGYGYNAFWTSTFGTDFAPILINDKIPHHAHNQWLQTLVNAGVIGFVFLAIFVLHALMRAVRTSLNPHANALKYFPLFLVVALTVNGIAEVPLFDTTFATALFILNYLYREKSTQ